MRVSNLGVSSFWRKIVIIAILRLDFLKVFRFSFQVLVVGPSAKDFYPLQRSKFIGGIFLL